MITVPEALWLRLLHELARHEPGVERVAYLDGMRAQVLTPQDRDSGADSSRCAESVATTLTLPNADLHQQFFTVSAEAMSEAGQHLRAWELTRLLQVHTHGSALVDHSRTDDRDAYSQRVGSVSVVLPWHAHHQQGFDGAAVHVRDRARWVRLNEDEISSCLRILPSVVDLRDPSCLTSATGTRAPRAVSSGQAPPRQGWQWRSWFRRR